MLNAMIIPVIVIQALLVQTPTPAGTDSANPAKTSRLMLASADYQSPSQTEFNAHNYSYPGYNHFPNGGSIDDADTSGKEVNEVGDSDFSGGCISIESNRNDSF